MTAVPHPRPKSPSSGRPGDVLLGEDWVSPDAMADASAGRRTRRSGIFVLERSPLARKIILFNLLALVILVSGVLFFNPFRDSLVVQHEQALVIEARLIAGTFEAILPEDVPQGSADLTRIAAQLPNGAGSLLQEFVHELAHKLAHR